MTYRQGLLITLAAASVALAAGFGPAPFWDEDETRFVAIAQTMLDTGDWVVPTYNGTLAVDKPVLMHWSIAASFAAFGRSEIAARIPAAVATLLTALAVFHAGSRWFSYLCGQRGLEPQATYLALVEQYMKGDVHCPLHVEARLEAGFSPAELDALRTMCAAGRSGQRPQ